MIKKFSFIKEKRNFKLKINIFFKSILKLLIVIIFLLLLNIIRFSPNLKKILLCTIAKQENKYIKEFIEHYRKLKIKKIIIYDNNDINGENFDYILKKYINFNYIDIINYRGLNQPQTMAINDCYEKYNNNYDWIAFYDIDEFLYIQNYTNLNFFLSQPKFNKCQNILINWKYYGDNNTVYYENKPLKERFIKEYNIEKLSFNKFYYCAAKSIIRGGLKLIWAFLPHYTNNTINCRADGKILDNYFSPPQYTFAYIKHYITKSTEEFIERLKRGDVMLKIDNNYINQKVNHYYFLFNKFTKEKIKLFKKEIFDNI